MGVLFEKVILGAQGKIKHSHSKNIACKQCFRPSRDVHFEVMTEFLVRLKMFNLYFNIYCIVWMYRQTTAEYLCFAAISKLIAAAATYPYQVIRARLQDQHHSYEGTWDCVKKIWKYEQMRGFYKGLVPYLLHVTPNICLVMLIYEKFTN